MIRPALTALTSAAIFPFVSDSVMQITDFPEISGTGHTGLSSILDLVFYRDDSAIGSDVLVKEFDIHYEIDALGSRSEYVK